MSLSREEQETIINFNEDESTASVYTYNGRLQRRLERLERERPQEVNRDHHGDFIFPKGWIKINPPRILSEQERERLTQQLKAST